MSVSIRFSRFSRFVLPLLLAAALFLLVGCEGRIESFSFVDRRGEEPVLLELRDPDALPPEEEATVSGAPRRLLLSEPLDVSNTAVYLRYRGSGAGARLRLGYESGEELTREELQLPATAGFSLPVSYHAPVSGGNRLREITVDPGAGALEIVELGVSRYTEGVEMSPAGLQISAGYDLASYDGVLYLMLPEAVGREASALLEIELDQPWEGVNEAADRPVVRIATLPGTPESAGIVGTVGALGSEAVISDAAVGGGDSNSGGGGSETSGGDMGPGVSEAAAGPAVSQSPLFDTGQSYRPVPGAQRVHLHSALREEPIRTVALTGGAGTAFKAFRRLPISEGSPIPADLGTLLTYPRELWRQDRYELFRWSAYPEILFIDTEDYRFQSELFKRLAFFVEKEGFRGRLLSDGELRGRHGWNAHNYRPEGLADFYNAAAAEEFPLNEAELLLRDIALEHGLIVESGAEEPYAPGVGGILSVSQESWSLLRELLLTHEALHGIYYQEPGFRERVATLWEEELTEAEREFWRFFLSYMSYDPEDTYLMQNEMQAYLLQYPLENIPGYFQGRIAARLRAGVPHRSSYVDNFMAEHGDGFGSAAARLNEFLLRETGFQGGDVLLLNAPE